MYQARGFPVPMFQQPVRQAFNPMSLPYNGPRHNEPPMNLPVAPIGQENQAPNHFQEPMPYNGAALMAPPPMNLPVAPIGQENQAPISSNHYQAPLPYNGAAPMPYTPVSTSGRSFGQEHPMVAPPLPANPPPLEDQTPNRGTIRFQIPKTEPAEPTSFVHRPQIKKEPMEEEDVRYIGTIGTVTSRKKLLLKTRIFAGGSLAMELRNLRAKEARRMREQEQRAAVIAPEAPVAAEQGEDAPAPVPAPAPAPEITEMFQKMVDFMATQNAFMQQLMTQGHSAPQELAQPARRGRKPALEGTAVSDAFEAAPRGRKRSSKPTERKVSDLSLALPNSI